MHGRQAKLGQARQGRAGAGAEAVTETALGAGAGQRQRQEHRRGKIGLGGGKHRDRAGYGRAGLTVFGIWEVEMVMTVVPRTAPRSPGQI